MKLNEQYTERIDRYLTGEMNLEEREAFEEDCRKDTTLRDQLKAQQALVEAIQVYDYTEKKKEAQQSQYEKPGVRFELPGDIDQQIRKVEQRLAIRRLVPIAAMLVIGFGLGWIMFGMNREDTGEQLANQEKEDTRNLAATPGLTKEIPFTFHTVDINGNTIATHTSTFTIMFQEQIADNAIHLIGKQLILPVSMVQENSSVAMVGWGLNAAAPSLMRLSIDEINYEIVPGEMIGRLHRFNE